MENIYNKINYGKGKYKLITVCDKNGNVKIDEDSKRRTGLIGSLYFMTVACEEKYCLMFIPVNENDENVNSCEQMGFITSLVNSVEEGEKQLIIHTENSGYYFEEVE